MHRLTEIISEVYNKYLPLAEKSGVSLNLDYQSTNQTLTDPETIKADIEQNLNSMLSQSEKGRITIAVHADSITISDSGTVLSKPICNLLSNSRVEVKTRVGFGTTVKIKFKTDSTEK